MRITELFYAGGAVAVGEELGNHGRVKSITFKGTNHSTHGHAGLPCYIVDFDNDIRKIFPHRVMTSLTVDRQSGGKVDEDVGHAPELPGQEE